MLQKISSALNLKNSAAKILKLLGICNSGTVPTWGVRIVIECAFHLKQALAVLVRLDLETTVPVSKQLRFAPPISVEAWAGETATLGV